MAQPSILYCHCQYAQVLPKELKNEVLRRLCESGVAFDAVADLCEMAARRDPALAQLAGKDGVKIAACFPRAVKGLFHQCGADLAADRTQILNMRVQTADEVVTALLSTELLPNLPVKGGPASNPGPTAQVPSPAESASVPLAEQAAPSEVLSPLSGIAPADAVSPAA